MAGTVNVAIDGRVIKVPEGMNLLDAAERAGVHVPNLCYLKGMKGIGACRLCLVEIEGMKAPVIACNTKVKDGMVIITRTKKVEEVRKFVIDLILSMHPLDCMTCTKAGVCRLQQYAYDFGIKESSFTRKKFGFLTDEANPFIKRDPDYCILCSACVRVCKEQGTSVLDFMGRGVSSKVTTAGDKPLQESGCTFCGSCVDVCPVNALLEADRWRKGREWEYKKVKSLCLSCGNGCDVVVSTKDGKIAKINAGAPEGSVEHFICAIGRFGYDSLGSELRITSPMKRTSEGLKETNWHDALTIIAERLKNATHSVCFLSTAGILNEDVLALKRFASDVIKTERIDSTVSLYADTDSMRGEDADLEASDFIVLVGLDPDQWRRVLPALDAIIRKKVRRGAKLVVIHSGEPKIASDATVTLKGDEALVLSQLAEALKKSEISYPTHPSPSRGEGEGGGESSELDEAAGFFAKARNIVILTAPHLFQASSNFITIARKLSLPIPQVVAVPLEANAKGLTLMGLVTDGVSYREMMGGKQKGMRVLYAIGEIPLPESGIRPDVEFLIVQHSHLTDLTLHADIVLPSAMVFESEGTIVDYLGRTKHVEKVLEPLGESKMHREIFTELAKVLGKKLKEATKTEIGRVIKPQKVKPSIAPFKKQEGFDIDPQELIESLNTSIINSPRLLWLRETERATPV